MMNPRKIAFLSSGLFYGVALFCPAFVFKEGHSSFIVGFVCLLFGFEHLAWYANPLYFGGFIALFFKKPRVAALLSGAALAVALTTLQIREVPRNESGTLTEVLGLGLGFYLWFASMLVILVAAVWECLRPSPAQQAPPPLTDRRAP